MLDDFPTLKLLVSHGGGAIPYQIGRFDATSVPRTGMQVSGGRFRDRLRKLYFDTVLYSREAYRAAGQGRRAVAMPLRR